MTNRFGLDKNGEINVQPVIPVSVLGPGKTGKVGGHEIRTRSYFSDPEGRAFGAYFNRQDLINVAAEKAREVYSKTGILPSRICTWQSNRNSKIIVVYDKKLKPETVSAIKSLIYDFYSQ